MNNLLKLFKNKEIEKYAVKLSDDDELVTSIDKNDIIKIQYNDVTIQAFVFDVINDTYKLTITKDGLVTTLLLNKNELSNFKFYKIIE